jgi:dUTP pyrophosphatase
VSEITLKEVEVQKLNLQPEDLLVANIKSDDVTHEFINYLQKELHEKLGNNLGILIACGKEGDVIFSALKRSTTVPVKIKKLHPDAQIPQYATDGSSGFDLRALEDVTIEPGQTKLIKTGLAFEVPEGYEIQVRPRSGMSLKTPIRVANAPGTVDADFRGEVCVIASFHPFEYFVSYTIKKGDRIAQGVICPVVQAEFEVVDGLEDTSRGRGGFGSSGV